MIILFYIHSLIDCWLFFSFVFLLLFQIKSSQILFIRISFGFYSSLLQNGYLILSSCCLYLSSFCFVFVLIIIIITLTKTSMEIETTISDQIRLFINSITFTILQIKMIIIPFGFIIIEIVFMFLLFSLGWCY